MTARLRWFAVSVTIEMTRGSPSGPNARSSHPAPASVAYP